MNKRAPLPLIASYAALIASLLLFSCTDMFTKLDNPTVASLDDLVIVSPKTGSTLTGTELTVSLVAGAATYAVRIAASEANLGVTNLYEKSDYTTNVLDISAASINNGTTYYWQARASTDFGVTWGAWTAAASFSSDFTANSAATPTFSPAGGMYASDQSVTISCATAGATIYYTTDGTDPSSSGTRISGASPLGSIAITAGQATTLRAIADGPWYSTSAEGSAGYNILVQMVSVAGGIFNNGTSDVTVSSFRMSKYEVTQAQYSEVTGNSPSSFSGDTSRPVEQATWYDAVEFCNKLSEREGLQNAYTITGRSPSSGNPITSATVTMDRTKNGYRLPTEAEWEYAARGGQSTHGYTYAGSNTIGDVAWYYDNSSGTTHAAGTKAANELGLYDMSGNVWEWCWDWYGTYPSGSQTDPTGTPSGTIRVERGGSWNYYENNCAVSVRSNNYPADRDDDIGFRVVAK